MFGHDDTQTHKQDGAASPAHDAVVSNDATTALPAVDAAATAQVGAPAPASPAASDSVGEFIATDEKGKPDTTASVPSVPAGGGDLIDIKQSALKELSPLVGHLNQTPEEKFRTMMMMIQAADDQSLIPQAYAAAKDISDEKTRAQALLDIINEINYFTQQHEN